MSSVLPWYVLLLPLISAAVIVLVTRKSSGISSFVSVGAALIGFACSCAIFVTPKIAAPELSWLDLRPHLYVPIGFILDGLSKTMLVLVTGVGAVIHVYFVRLHARRAGQVRATSRLSRSSCSRCWASSSRTIS
jgi:NADH-quinone oxidoreductase subunit L